MNLNKNCFLLLLSLITALLLLGCVSYGRYKPETPVNQRVLVELAPGLDMVESKEILWIGDMWENEGREVISIPAGTQSLTFDYTGQDNFSRSGDYVRYTEYKATVEITYDFEAGHHYMITPRRYTEGDKTYVELTVQDLGTNTSLFHNGVYTGTVVAMDMHLGSGGLSYVMAGLGFGGKAVFDVGTVLELSVNGGVDFGIGPGGNYDPKTRYDYSVNPPREYTEYDTSVLSIAIGAFAGLFGHFYIPRTDISIGAGYGYRAEVGLMSPYDMFYSPFIRGEILKGGMGVYFEYYTAPSYLGLFGSQAPDNFNIFKKWGVGLFGRM